MKKRSIFSLVLAVVMLFSVFGVFPMTVSAAGASYADDAAAIEGGMTCKAVVGGATLYYANLLEACHAADDSSTINLIANVAIATASQTVGGVNYSSGTGADNKAWNSIKTLTIEGNDKTISYNVNRGFDILNCNMTMQNLTISQTGGTVTFAQVRSGTTLTLDNVTVNATNTQWGVFVTYGNLILKGTTHITCTGESHPSSTACVRLQASVNANDINGTANPTLTMQDSARLDANIFPICDASTSADRVVVTSKSVVITSVAGKTLSMGSRATLPAYSDGDDAATVEALNALYAYFGKTVIARIGETTYTSIVDAINAVAEGGTIEMLANASQDVVSIGSGSDALKSFTINGNNKTLTITGGNGIGFYKKNVTINNLTVVNGSNSVNFLMRAWAGSTITFKNSTATATSPTYGAFGIFDGELVVDNSTITSNTIAIRMQANNDGNTQDTILTIKAGANISGTTNSISIMHGNANRSVNVTVQSSDVTLSGSITGDAINNLTLGTPVTEEEKTAWRPIYTFFNQPWPFDYVAKIGETGYSMTDALAAVTNGQTIVLTADLTAAITVNNGKTFTIDGDGHSVTVNGAAAMTVNSGSAVTLTDISIINSNATCTTTVELAGGTLILGDGALLKNTATWANANSRGNGVRVTANGASFTMLAGSEIQCTGGAFVADATTATLDIQGGTVTTGFYFAIFTGSAVNITISGGTLTSNYTGTDRSPFRVYNGGAGHSVVISGGTINFKNGTNLFADGGSGAALDPVLPAWVTITGTAIINKTTEGAESTLNVATEKAAIGELATLTSGDANLRIPVRAIAANSGIAFQTSITKAAYDALVAAYGESKVKTGTLILPESYLGGAAATYDNIIALGANRSLNIVNSGWYNEADTEATSHIWYGSVINLKNANIARNFVGVGYVGVTKSFAGIGDVTFGIGATATTANARTLATAAADGNAAQTEILNLYRGV